MRTNLIKKITNLPEEKKVTLWNEYQDGAILNNHIYINDLSFIYEVLNGEDTMYILNLCENNNYNLKSKYVYHNDTYDWTTTDDLNKVFEPSDVADWLLDDNGVSSIIDINDI